jgi:predicted hydrocarbon binding protein
MNSTIRKNRSWIAHLHKGIDQMDVPAKADIMRQAGAACASELLCLCQKYLGKRIESVEDLVVGWNMIREERRLRGKWQIRGRTIMGVFAECGCPLVRSGLVELHPVQCYCSQGMMETVFSQAANRTVEVKIERTIGRGDDVCEFLIKL